jgi:hypothetical protein
MLSAANNDNARLRRTDTNEDVVFDFNPAAIVISHTAPMQPSAGRGGRREGGGDGKGSSSTAVVGNWDEMAKANGVTSINIRAVTFNGPQLVQNCTLLLSWSQFKDVGSSAQKQDLPELKFIWGPQTYTANLNQVTINYSRFSRTGVPVRAVVDMTLHVIPKPLQPTNPSSGGLSGRRTHLLTGAESLPELATRTYGGPHRWREIATANGIEDPLRVRPGTLVYLPSAQEEDGR